MNSDLNFPFEILNRLRQDTEYPLSDFPTFKYKESFNCVKCQAKNEFEIEFYKSGLPLELLYKTNKFISKEQLIAHTIARLPLKGQDYLGELTLWQVSAHFLFKQCVSCDSNYILVFGMGEIQPGRESLQISGIWEIKNSNPK